MKLSDHALAAKSIKEELSRAFPGIRFSVRSRGFSMGDDVQVNWQNGPTVDQVEAIANKYQEGDFDGMQDLYEYRHNRPNTNGSAKYVFCDRGFDAETWKTLVKSLCEYEGVEYHEPIENIKMPSQQEYMTTIIYRITRKQGIPAGHKVIGLERTDCTCGLIEEFFKISTRP